MTLRHFWASIPTTLLLTKNQFWYKLGTVWIDRTAGGRGAFDTKELNSSTTTHLMLHRSSFLNSQGLRVVAQKTCTPFTPPPWQIWALVNLKLLKCKNYVFCFSVSSGPNAVAGMWTRGSLKSVYQRKKEEMSGGEKKEWRKEERREGRKKPNGQSPQSPLLLKHNYYLRRGEHGPVSSP